MEVSFYKPYQVADSTLLSNPFGEKNQNKSTELQLIEEVDEQVNLPNFKKKYYKKSDFQELETDTFYGIANDAEIPIRSTSIKNIIEEKGPVEILFSPTQLPVNVAIWQTILLLFTIVLLGITKAFSKNRFNLSVKALFNNTVANEIIREEKVFFHQSNTLFVIIHLLTTSLFLYHLKGALNSTSLNENNISTFTFLVAFLTIMYLVKYLFSKLLFFILGDANIASEYVFNVALYNNLLGVILIPILSLIYFSSIDFNILLIYVTLPLITLTFVLRVIRLFVIGISKRISYFYIFLYICTLEILPLVVLFRIFIFK